MESSIMEASIMDSSLNKKRSQRCIPLEVKLKILEEVEKRNYSKSQIAEIYNIPRSTLSTIIKNKEKIDRAVATGSKTETCKRLRKAAHVDMEEQLLEWFRYMRSINVPISGPMIQEKAREISKSLDIKDFDCSSGWLWRFQKRNIVFPDLSLTLNKLDQLEVSGWLKFFDQLRNSYTDKDIFNLDETGVFFNLLPDRTLESNSGEMSNDTLTAMACCNANGSEKLKLWLIGKSKNPLYLNKIDKIQLPFEYTYHKHSWVDSHTFREWLSKFQQKMAQENRKVLLTIDSCTAHRIDGMDLPNVRVVFFPQSASNKIHPLNQGIINNLKRTFKLRLIRFIVLSIESKQLNPRWNLLQAMKALAASWETITPQTIQKCFRKAWEIGSTQDEFAESEEPEEWRVLKNIVSSENVSFSDFVQIDDDLATCLQPDDDDEEDGVILNGRIDHEESVGNEEIHENPVPKPSKNELLSALSVIHNFAQTTPELDLNFIEALEKVTKDCITFSRKPKLKE